MVKELTEKLRASGWMALYKRLSPVPDFLFWKVWGSPGPKVPHLIKERAIKRLGSEFGLQVLIETGTQFGQMVSAAKDHFREIYSIELDPRRYEAARRHFARDAHIHLLQGDSAVMLPRLLESVFEPCLFWLDAHSYSSPLTAELSTIFRHPVRGHVILIDDAHCFDGRVWSPTLDEIRQLVAVASPGAAVEVQENMIRICQARSADDLPPLRVR